MFEFLFKKKRFEHPELPYKKTITSLDELKSTVKAPFNFIVFDTETNGFTRKDGVLSISALKYFYDGTTFNQIGVFERFYFPKGRFNKNAVAVNGLNRRTIRKYRKGTHYPRHWYQDMKSFRDFIGTDTELFVGHNITFDRKFYWFLDNRNAFCTMFSNMSTMGLRTEAGRLKMPKLMETASFYNIPIEEEKLHASSYDTELTLEIFKKMIDGLFVEEVVF